MIDETERGKLKSYMVVLKVFVLLSSLENSTVMTRIIPARFEFLNGNVEEKNIL